MTRIGGMQELGLCLVSQPSKDPCTSTKGPRPRWNKSIIVSQQVNAEGVHVWPFVHELQTDVVYHQLSGRRPFRMNRHDYFEMVYVHEGELVWQVQDRFMTQRTGELFLVGSTLYHRLTERSHPRVKVISLHFLPDAIRSSAPPGEAEEYLMSFLMQDATFPHVILAKTGVPARTLPILEKIHDGLPAMSPLARLSVKTHLKLLLLQLANHYAAYRSARNEFNRRQQALQRLQPLFAFLEKRYSEMISVEDAAGLIRMSKSHFMAFFREVTGQSFIAYLTHFRIAKAQELLVKTDKTIAEVGQELGYCDQSYFGATFRALTHMTPFEYRRSHTTPVTREAPSPVKQVAPSAS